MPPVPRRAVVALLAGAAFCLPAAAGAQISIPEGGADVSPTPPVPLARQTALPASSRELPNTGTDPRMLFLGGLALTLMGVGLRLRTADVDDY